MSDAIRLSVVTLNVPDALELARFYADVTGGDARGDAGWALTTGPGGDIALQQGASQFDHQPNDDHCLVYSDPAGHPFCLSLGDSPRLAETDTRTAD